MDCINIESFERVIEFSISYLDKKKLEAEDERSRTLLEGKIDAYSDILLCLKLMKSLRSGRYEE